MCLWSLGGFAVDTRQAGLSIKKTHTQQPLELDEQKEQFFYGQFNLYNLSFSLCLQKSLRVCTLIKTKYPYHTKNGFKSEPESKSNEDTDSDITSQLYKAVSHFGHKKPLSISSAGVMNSGTVY